ncbi:MAG: preprotein translocase subunit SecG, partial [Minisyncoccota bacterium]
RSDGELGGAFGGDSGGGTRYSRRGFEKFLFKATIIVAILFTVAAFASLFYRS